MSKFKLLEHNDDMQMRFVGGDDTRKYLIEGNVYDGIKEVHSWYTHIIINKRKFNSVCFEELGKDGGG
jgi:hypothetical protein